MARIPARMISAAPRRAGGRGDGGCGGRAGVPGAASRPLAIDLEKFRSKGGLPIRFGQKCSKFGAFLELHLSYIAVMVTGGTLSPIHHPGIGGPDFWPMSLI